MSTDAQKNIVLVQGVVGNSLFDRLKKEKAEEVFVMEGRPNLDAAESSSRELLKRKITPTLIADNMAGFLFYKNRVKEIWLAYQLTDTNGALCDIGALTIAVLGKAHNVPVYLFPAGRKTPFLGKENDLVNFKNTRIAPKGTRVYIPLVEWLPKKYITRIHND